MSNVQKIFKRHSNISGDTIVEVLLAITIAAFAIAISYATAQRSLHQTITAREHNEALNVIENQLADLKLRFQNTPPSGFSPFAAPTSNHFCLDDTSSDPSAANWAPYYNDTSLTESSPLSSPNPYNTKCQKQRPGEGAVYYVDIVTSASSASQNPTLYQIIVRWDRIGGGQNNQASIFYKLNGDNSLTLGASTAGSGGPACGQNYYDIVLTMDTSSSMKNPFATDLTGRIKLDVERAAAVQLLNNLNLASPGNRAGAVYFNSTTGILQNLTTNLSALTNSVNTMPWSTGTNYGAGLDASTTVLSGYSPPKDRVIVFMSDGEPSYGIIDPATLLSKTSAMENSGIVIYTIGIDVAAGSAAENLMRQMAGGTDSAGNVGVYASADNATDFDAINQELTGKLSC